ncbi:MAG: hypothetical protein ACKVS6_00775 [Planctomycetota bacterium]
MRFITTVLASARSRRIVLPTLGILAIFCGIAALGSNATARMAGAPGPMSGNWIFTVNNSEHNNTGSKPVKEKQTLQFSITDSQGTISNISMQSIGGEDNIFLVGTRVGTAFYVESAETGVESEFTAISGTIGKPDVNGQSKTLKATGASVGFIVSALPGTSDGEGVSGITLLKISGKRDSD